MEKNVVLLKEQKVEFSILQDHYCFWRIAGKLMPLQENSAWLPHRAVQANGSQIELFLLDAIFIKVFENLSGKHPYTLGACMACT